MLYRTLGKSGLIVSILGFGCMRLPMIGGIGPADIFDRNKAIDEEEAMKMVRYAVDKGVNYFDTAYPYHGGKSETFLGKALKDCRHKVMIATKLPTWLVQNPDHFERFFNEQLQRLDTGYIDVYLLHGLNRLLWAGMKDMGALKFLDKIQTEGRARHVGFSFHDDVRIFQEIIDAYDWSICQIQYNYLDEHRQAGRGGLLYAASKGLGIVVMEPLRGGKLTTRIPAPIQALWDSASIKRTPAEWALRWVWNHPDVSTVLSGMSNMSQVVENVALARQGNPDSLSLEELELIHRVRDTYEGMLKIPCTGCAYCMPCPNGVDIPYNFSLYNDSFLFHDVDLTVMLYNQLLAPEDRASNCVECGECEKLCPQQIKITEELKEVHRRLAR
jgi:predicted aldo/keto reductase-like oxidoreductase